MLVGAFVAMIAGTALTEKQHPPDGPGGDSPIGRYPSSIPTLLLMLPERGGRRHIIVLSTVAEGVYVHSRPL